ncbi:hypothetical protein C2845_PM07G22660 [Panicum miliaceum]|uniref:CULT domain-containing protein n=1 Tax=Panicum miliaceum TaxID=4540 RepID=A0A3L6SII2_PANMI|nr:hypothetical protein C2845_PM07G22660 [Panicum miliaceum]
MAEPDWILERERRQMEQILELDMEELQVEEVDDDGSSSSSVDTFLRNTHRDGGISTSEELTVDTSMVSLKVHAYLEAKVDGTRGKFAFLDYDKVLNLPMLYLQGVVLFPEASLPLRVIQPRLAEAIDKAVNHVDAPCMIGVVHAYRRANDGHHTIASVGTMAEIQEIQQLDDGSSCVFSRGQQRFCLPWGEVRIIKEDTPQRTPRDAFGQLAAKTDGCGQQDKHTNTGDWDDLCFTSFLGVRKKNTEQQRHYWGGYNRKMASQAPLSFWPRWTYEIYDSYSLARRAADLWRQTSIARRSDMVMMSSVDAIVSYSSVKEMITVHSVTSLALRGDPSKIYTWFPGYTWTIALSAACESNIGWLFRADKNLHPKSFWGIRNSQISDDTQSGQV